MNNSAPSPTPSVSDDWIYETNEDNTARFVLGTVGTHPLLCFGVNPSTAEPGHLDQTMRRVHGYADRNGFDSWLMFNLYPQRSTDPQGLHHAYQPDLKAWNEQFIAEFLRSRPTSLLAAWGEPVAARPYLRDLLADIVRLTDAASCDWLAIGSPIKNGHPRHPSRGSYLPLRPFDMPAYLRGRRKEPEKS